MERFIVITKISPIRSSFAL